MQSDRLRPPSHGRYVGVVTVDELKELRRKVALYEQQIPGLQRQNQQMNERIARLNTEAATLRSEKQTFAAAQQQKHEQIVRVQMKVLEQNELNKKTEYELQLQKQIVTRLLTESDTLRTEIKTHSETIAKAKFCVNKLKEQLAEEKKRRDEKVKELQFVVAKFESLASLVRQRSQTINNLQQQNRALQNDLENLKSNADVKPVVRKRIKREMKFEVID